MKKMLKQNKGFSLVELLVAILIMAVIAGTAITLFGGVLGSSRENADKETAENIKRAILTYMNMTNDTNLNCLGMSQATPWTDSEDLIKKLCCTIEIADGSGGNAKSVKFDMPTQVGTATIGEVNGGDATDINGTYHPFIDGTKDMVPKTPGKAGWAISIDPEAQVIKVETADNSSDAIVKFE